MLEEWNEEVDGKGSNENVLSGGCVKEVAGGFRWSLDGLIRLSEEHGNGSDGCSSLSENRVNGGGGGGRGGDTVGGDRRGDNEGDSTSMTLTEAVSML
jgi:hypothetical protein